MSNKLNQTAADTQTAATAQTVKHTLGEISKLSSEDLQTLVSTFFTDAQFKVLAKNAKDVIEQNADVIAAKAALEAAKLNAYYNSADTQEDAKAVIDLTLRKVVTYCGGHWDNKTQRFDNSAQVMYSALYSVATDSDTHDTATRPDGDTSRRVMLRTPAEVAGWLGDAAKSYIKETAKGKKTRKGIADRIKTYYQGCIDFDDTPETATAKAAKKFGITAEEVATYIK